jgi:hypothetical protein
MKEESFTKLITLFLGEKLNVPYLGWGVMILPRAERSTCRWRFLKRTKRCKQSRALALLLQVLYRSHPLPHGVFMHVPVAFLLWHARCGLVEPELTVLYVEIEIDSISLWCVGSSLWHNQGRIPLHYARLIRLVHPHPPSN